MKKIYLLLVCITLQSCFYSENDDADINEEPFFGLYEPVIMDRTEFEASTSYENTPRSIENSGKIYVKGNYIYVNEVNKGFHIFNNSNPSQPTNIGFITVLGSSDLSVKDDVLYANNATDLIAFTINESEATVTITKRIEKVFPQIWSPEGFVYYNLQENEVIVDWILAE